MKRLCFPVLPVTLFALSCGSGRQLQSITITQTVNGQQIQFVATGKFSATPTTVTPLPVEWTIGLMAPPPPTYSYTLSAEPYVFHCSGPGPFLPIGAYAPPDPNAASSGSSKHVVVTYAQPNCP